MNEKDMKSNIPQNILYQIIRQPRNIVATFIAAMSVGLFAHLYMLTNKLPNADDVGAMNAYGQGARVGRWFLEIMGEFVGKFVENYSMPLFNGLVLIVLLAVSACVVVKIFGIEDLACCIFVGALFTCFPSVVNTMQFMFTAPYYGVGILFAVLSARCIIKSRSILGMCAGIILLVLSVATYQAYFPLCFSILVAKLIQDVQREQWFKNSFRYAGCFFAGMGGYFVTCFLYNRFFEVEMVSYKGADAWGDFSINEVFRNIPNAYRAFIRLMTSGYMGLTEYRLLRIIFAIFVIIAGMILTYRFVGLIREKMYLRAGGMLLLSLCYPLAIFSLYFSGVGGAAFYAIMLFPVVMLYVLPIILISDINKEHGCMSAISEKFVGMINYIVCFAMLGVIILYCRFSNEYYLWMQIDYEQTSSYCTTLITQIKECEGYTKDSEVVILGYCVEDESITGTDNFPDITLGGSYEEGNAGMLQTYNYRAFIQNYCGFGQINRELEDEVSCWAEVNDMPVYPSEGAIQNIRGIIVVKLAEE